MIEYAASFPSEAEDSLKAKRERIQRILGGLLSTHRQMICDNTSISSRPVLLANGEGAYEYEIELTQELKDHLATQSRKVLSRYGDPDTIFKRWDAFWSLAEQEGNVFHSTNDHNYEKIFYVADPAGKILQETTAIEANEYDAYVRVKPFWI